MKLLYISVLLLLPYSTHTASRENSVSFPYKAVCVIPVADLVTEPLAQKFPSASTQEIDSLYHKFHCTNINNVDLIRTHQLLYNETVDVIAIQGKEAQIHIKNTYYLHPKNNTKESTYWTLLSNLEPITADNNSNIPFPFDYSNPPTTSSFSENTIFTVIDSATFSAGTRFLINQIDRAQYQTHLPLIRHDGMPHLEAKSNGILNTPLTTIDQQKQAIIAAVTLLKQWANSEKRIPTVWGGCSAMPRYGYEPLAFTKETLTLPNTTTVEGFEREKQEEFCVHKGLDISGMCLRAFQIYGIPFFAKNTTTIPKIVRELNYVDNESIEIGDIVSAPGYAGIISDVDNNKIIQTRSYTYHNGCIEEVCLNQVFEGITSYDELKSAAQQKRELIFLDKNSNPITFNSGNKLSNPVAILKTHSVFDVTKIN